MDAEQAHVMAYSLCETQITDTLTNLPEGEKIYQVISVASFALYKVTETQLRNLLTISGINLDDPDVREKASSLATIFVLTDALQVTDLLPCSLINSDADGIDELVVNDELASRMEDIRFKGIMWRAEFFD